MLPRLPSRLDEEKDPRHIVHIGQYRCAGPGSALATLHPHHEGGEEGFGSPRAGTWIAACLWQGSQRTIRFQPLKKD